MNIKTKEIKVLKELPVKISDKNLSNEMIVGKGVGKDCIYLVYYYEIFETQGFEYIVMDFFRNGDLSSYLKKGNKMKETVKYFIIFYYYLLYIDNIN
jgi:serine/threonine protein kinase